MLLSLHSAISQESRTFYDWKGAFIYLFIFISFFFGGRKDMVSLLARDLGNEMQPESRDENTWVSVSGFETDIGVRGRKKKH